MKTMVSAELRAVVDGCADGAALIDADHRVLHFNDAYARLVGVSRLRLRQRISEGARCSDLTPLTVCKKECIGCRAVEAKVPIRVDRVGLDEPVDPYSSVASIVSDVQEMQVAATPIGDGIVLETYRDTTAESRLHARWREAIRRERERGAELEELVAKRTADLVRSNDELRKTQAHLVQQEKMSSLGLLVAGVAHEINNPINFIVCNLPFLENYVGALEQLVEALEAAISPTAHDAIDELRKALEIEYLRSDAPHLMQSIRNGAQRAGAIVSDLRTFSRGGDEKNAPVDLVAGIDTTINLVRPLLTSGIKIVRKLDPVAPVSGQPGQLNQVFMNLVTNAIQAVRARGPNAEGTITVRTSEDETHVIVDVIDDGIGIAPEHRDRIFDPFFTTKPVGQGTGLGLSISYGIVERHGGRMSFTTEQDKGTAFTVRLPKMLASDLVTPEDTAPREHTTDRNLGDHVQTGEA
jgi:signal transduction histidine kinase